MKKLLIAAFAVAIFAGQASAADMAPRAYSKAPPPMMAIWDWTGFYVGGSVGGHWGDDRIDPAANPVGWGIAGAADLNRFTQTGLHPQGAIVGGQAGYNWQAGNYVFGVEADASWVDGTAARAQVPPVGFLVINAGDRMTNSSNLDFLATFRGRAGWAAGDALFYVTGGLAVGELKTTDTFCSFGGPCVGGNLATVTASQTRAGWTVGGGIEYHVGGNWTVKAEYLYVDLGTFSPSIPSCALCAVGSDITVNHRYTDNIGRVGLNYKFGGPVVARY